MIDCGGEDCGFESSSNHRLKNSLHPQVNGYLRGNAGLWDILPGNMPRYAEGISGQRRPGSGPSCPFTESLDAAKYISGEQLAVETSDVQSDLDFRLHNPRIHFRITCPIS